MKSTRVDGKRSTCSFGLALIWLVRLPGGFSITSTSPLCRDSTRLLSLVMILIFTVEIFGLVPYQFGLTFRSTSDSGWYELTTNGPLPTGWVKKASPWASTSFCGRAAKAYIARSASSGACGLDSLTVTVLASGAVTEVTAVMRKPQPPSYFLARLIDQATSWAVTGEPSENLASRRWKV